MSNNSKTSKKIDLRSWKKTWEAETATVEEAKSLRSQLVELYQNGSDRERKTARILKRCRRRKRCGSPECPVCKRRRRRKALGNPPMHTMPPLVAVTETAVPWKEPVEAPKPALLLEIGAPAGIAEIPSLMPALGEVAESAAPRKEIGQATRVLRSLVDQNVDRLSVPAEPIPFHQFAEIFPMLDDDRLNELVRDIKDHGLLDAIVLYEGKILDGRCRYLACKVAGVEPRFEIYDGADALGFAVSRNLHRRHLNESQRAMVAARVANLKIGANQYAVGTPIGAAAKLLNVSARSVTRAKEVLGAGVPELTKAVECGEVSVSAAAALSREQATASSHDTEVRLASLTHRPTNAPALRRTCLRTAPWSRRQARKWDFLRSRRRPWVWPLGSPYSSYPRLASRFSSAA